MLRQNIIDAIGRTPLVRLRQEHPGTGDVYAKLELLNPFGMKDRVAKQTILEAKRTGLLRDGAPIIESSSGTMALGVGLVGTYLGHEVHIVTDPRIDAITLAKLQTIGCVVHVVERMTAYGWQSARLERLAELMELYPGAFWPRQYENPDNPLAYRALAHELLDELDHVDILVGSIGSGGSLCGTARELRKANPALRVVAVDAVGSVLFGQPDHPGRLQSGLGNSLVPPNLDHALVDEVHWLSDAEAFSATLALAREEKIFAGNSSGSAYAVARWLARTTAAGTNIVTILPDRGDRYVDTIYSADYRASHQLDALDLPAAPQEVPPGQIVQSWSFAQLKQAPARRDTLVFIESNTTGSGMLALHKAHALGYTPVLLTNHPQRYRGLADAPCEVLECDTNSLDAIRQVISARLDTARLRGVTTLSEFYLATAAQIAADYKLPGNPPDAIRVCRNKAETRTTLAAAGVRQPRFAIVGGTGVLSDVLPEIGLPCIVKPTDDTGSNEVRLCYSLEEVARQVARIVATSSNMRGQPTARQALVEEFLDAPEFSVEMFSWQGTTTCIGMTEKHISGLPYFVEERHVFPAPLPPATARQLEATVRAALHAVGVTHGATHTEVKLTADGCAIVEINARLAGGMIPALIEAAAGLDMLEQQLKAAVGQAPDLTHQQDRCAGIQFLIAAEAGVLEQIEGVEEARMLPGIIEAELTAASGCEVVPARNAYDRLGYIIASGDSYDLTMARLRQAQERITILLADVVGDVAGGSR